MSCGFDELFRYTDFISPSQELLVWGFDIDELERQYDVCFYSAPVEDAFCRAIAKLRRHHGGAAEQSFTVFVGDAMPGENIYCLGIPASVTPATAELIGSHLEQVNGYLCTEFGSMPYLPLVARFRYEKGRVFEYGEADLAGKVNRDRSRRAGFEVAWRHRESAVLTGGRERFCSEAELQTAQEG